MNNAAQSRPWRLPATIVLAGLLSACGGGGGGPSELPNDPTPPGGTVTVTGRITFDRIPFDATLGQGLNPGAIVELPAQGVVVEAVAENSGQTLASAVTNAAGDYSLSVPPQTRMFIRAKAQMSKTGPAPSWTVRVLNNVNSSALYAVVGATFDSGTVASVKDVRAGSGWGGAGYTTDRAAAPFAILDTIRKAQEKILSASANATFPVLEIFWSPNNRPTTDFCIEEGHIGTTFYTPGGSDPTECTGSIDPGMYVLGDASGDSDEFDEHVLLHEYGHYVENAFSRSDSIGGEHDYGTKLDLRVAFGEGWGNAFAAIVLNDPKYRDSYGGMASDDHYDFEDDDSFGGEGWFSEISVTEILWDLFDATNEPGDAVTIGFDSIFAAMTSGQKTTSALTSIYSFLSAIKNREPSQASAINVLREQEGIEGTDEFGAGELNNGGDPLNLPVYRALVLNDPQQFVCVRAANGTVNKLGFNQFFRLNLDARKLVTITVIGTANPDVAGSQPAQDPDIYVYRSGEEIVREDGIAPTAVISQEDLAAGTYIIEVLEPSLSGNVARCMTISATGV